MTVHCHRYIIGREVRHGCPLSPLYHRERSKILSPLLFNIYIQSFLDEALENKEDGVKVGGHLVNAIKFTDDQAMVANSKAGLHQAMVANSKAGLQRIMDALNKITEEYVRRINIKNIKVMRISKNKTKQLKISIDGNILYYRNKL